MPEAAKFPARRLKDAGATQAEIRELQMAFARSDAVFQRDLETAFRGKSKVEVQVWLEDARRDGEVSREATATADPDEPAAERKKRDNANASVTTGNEGATEGED